MTQTTDLHDKENFGGRLRVRLGPQRGLCGFLLRRPGPNTWWPQIGESLRPRIQGTCGLQRERVRQTRPGEEPVCPAVKAGKLKPPSCERGRGTRKVNSRGSKPPHFCGEVGTGNELERLKASGSRIDAAPPYFGHGDLL